MEGDIGSGKEHPVREEVQGKLNRIIKAEKATSVKSWDILRASNRSQETAEAILGIVQRPNYSGDLEGFGGTIDPWLERAESQSLTFRGLGFPSSDSFAEIAASSFSGTTAKVKTWPVTTEDLLAVAHFEAAITRPDLPPKVEEEMRRLGLDKGYTRNESPLDLLREAHLLYEARTDTSIAAPSILALRSCLNEMFGLLLLHRPGVERKQKAGPDVEKIKSLGRYLGMDDLPAGTVDAWLSSWDDIGGMGSLDDRKAAKLSHDEWRRILFEYTGWLRGFLSALDPGKFRA